ncbi:MAG: AAA family ATPase [Thermodesulfobacterium sp.]|nr:AAA family ATPase [Thermodesulfobacterium sp.]
MLHKIELKNFKNFLEFRLDKFAQINLIVGKNNVGKTNLLESLLIY